jgi:hypothetical protein
MPRSKAPDSAGDPVLLLKTLALRDDPLVHDYRKICYQLFANGRSAAHLLSVDRWQLMLQHTRLAGEICKRYNITGLHGGDPQSIPETDWLATLTATNEILKIKTNWRSSLFSPWVPQETVMADGAVNALAKRLYQHRLPERPTNDPPPVLTFEVSLSQVKRNDLAPLLKQIQRAVQECPDELPKLLKRGPSLWQENTCRDYSRFRLHQRGMPFRWIAYQEKTGRAPSGPVTGPVPTESSVRESVERVHLILFNKKYSARRHKTSLREIPLKQACDNFKCPLHGRDDCPLVCKHAQNFMQQIEPLQEPLLK